MGNSFNGFDINFDLGDNFGFSNRSSSNRFDYMADRDLYREVLCNRGGCYDTGRVVFEDPYFSRRFDRFDYDFRTATDYFPGSRNADYRIGRDSYYRNDFPDWSIYSDSSSMNPRFRIGFIDPESSLAFRLDTGYQRHEEDYGYRTADYRYRSFQNRARNFYEDRRDYRYGDNTDNRQGVRVGLNLGGVNLGFRIPI